MVRQGKEDQENMVDMEKGTEKRGKIGRKPKLEKEDTQRNKAKWNRGKTLDGYVKRSQECRKIKLREVKLRNQRVKKQHIKVKGLKVKEELREWLNEVT